MDEPKGTQGDSGQDVKPSEQASQGDEGTTSQQPQTYTQEQVHKLLSETTAKAVSDALAKAGRDAKSFEEREQSLNEGLENLKTAQEEVDNLIAELKNPDALDWSAKKKALDEAKKTLQKEKTDFAKLKAETESDVKLAKDTLREIKLWDIASKYSVDAMLLKNLGIEDMEQVEEIAKSIGTVKKADGLKPDSGVTQGASRDVSSMSPDEKLAAGFKKQYGK